jgi:outer membrane protein assembly factor BamB
VLGFTTAHAATHAAPAPVFGLDPANTNVSPYVGPIADPVVRWQIPHERGQIDNPALILDARGVLFSQRLTPVDSATGRPAGINIPSARDSTPALDRDGNIYQWERGRMHAYAPTGAPLWTGPVTYFTDGRGVKLGPDGTVYAGGGDNQLYAFSPRGQLLWSRPGYGPTNPPPAIDAAGNLYLASGYGSGDYISYDRNGNRRWAVPWKESWNYAPPILGPDGNLYVSEDYGTSVYVLNTATGALVRHQENLYGGIQAISADGTLYSCSYHTVTATDLQGKPLWQTDVSADVFLQDLVVDAAGNVYCTSEENQLLAFSAGGERRWMLQFPESDWGTLPPVIGPDGTLYVQNGDLLMAIGGTVPEPAAAALFAAPLAAGLRRPRRRGAPV